MGIFNKQNTNKGKLFCFYYDMCCQNLTVFPGTSSEEIKSEIREILNIPKESKLEYLDENGNPIVISSALPDKIKIYIKIKKTFTEKYIEKKKAEPVKIIPNSIEWTWEESTSPKTHLRSNDNKTIYQRYNSCVAKAKGTLVIEFGEYYYTLLFEPLQCCVSAGICPINQNYGFGFDCIYEDFWRIWPDYDDPHIKFPGPVIEAGFYINMKSHIVVIYDNRKKKEVKRYMFNSSWTKVSPIVKFKHVVSITITSPAISGKPDFIK